MRSVAEGEPADRFYVVTSGEAEVIQRSANRDVYIRTFAPGEYFGEHLEHRRARQA